MILPKKMLKIGKGVSFAGVMAFIFSDLVVFPVLRINAKYYGWKMSFFILFLLLTALVGTSLILHYGFDVFNLIPDPSQVNIQNSEYFKFDYTFYLNIIFLIISGYLIYLGFFKKKDVKSNSSEMAPKGSLLENVLKYLAFFCYIWLTGGIFVKFFL